MITCEPSTSVIVAPARSAIDRTTSVPAALSDRATTAQDGRSFHAGAPFGSEKRELGDRALRRRQQWRQLVGQVRGEHLVDLRGIDGELDRRIPVRRRVLAGHQGAAEDAVFRRGRGVTEQLALFRGKGGDIDETDDVLRLARGVRDHGAAVGVADGENRAGSLREDARGVRGINRDAPQRIGGRSHLHTLGVQSLDDSVPARAIGKCSMHEHNGGRFLRHGAPFLNVNNGGVIDAKARGVPRAPVYERSDLNEARISSEKAMRPRLVAARAVIQSRADLDSRPVRSYQAGRVTASSTIGRFALCGRARRSR